jgi:hypothetical protein
VCLPRAAARSTTLAFRLGQVDPQERTTRRKKTFTTREAGSTVPSARQLGRTKNNQEGRHDSKIGRRR